jgi:hypothetical protein
MKFQATVVVLLVAILIAVVVGFYGLQPSQEDASFNEAVRVRKESREVAIRSRDANRRAAASGPSASAAPGR